MSINTTIDSKRPGPSSKKGANKPLFGTLFRKPKHQKQRGYDPLVETIPPVVQELMDFIEREGTQRDLVLMNKVLKVKEFFGSLVFLMKSKPSRRTSNEVFFHQNNNI
jgi:hypothetical protein